MTEQEEIADTLEAYANMPHYLRLRLPMGKPWSPKMTEQQQKELDEYVIEHKCPF